MPPDDRRAKSPRPREALKHPLRRTLFRLVVFLEVLSSREALDHLHGYEEFGAADLEEVERHAGALAREELLRRSRRSRPREEVVYQPTPTGAALLREIDPVILRWERA